MRRGHDQDLEALVARASDPRWIPAIYNFCDRRCARCRFSERCFAFNEDVEMAPAGGRGGCRLRKPRPTFRLLHAYAESEGIDLEPGDPVEAPARDAVEGDPLVVAAHQYASESWKLLNVLESQLDAAAAVDVRDAIDSLQWLSTMIGPKIYRALAGLIEPLSPADHATQNDAHGSAKTARLMIVDSLAAWRVVNHFGRAAPDSPTRTLATMLERIDQDLAERIPRAMEFVRPGFDEPIPGVIRPWSLTVDDERGDRRFLAASAILTKLKDFGRRPLTALQMSMGTVNAERRDRTNKKTRCCCISRHRVFLFVLMPAATYSPTQFPTQYHRR